MGWSLVPFTTTTEGKVLERSPLTLGATEIVLGRESEPLSHLINKNDFGYFAISRRQASVRLDGDGNAVRLTTLGGNACLVKRAGSANQRPLVKDDSTVLRHADCFCLLAVLDADRRNEIYWMRVESDEEKAKEETA